MRESGEEQLVCELDWEVDMLGNRVCAGACD